MNKRLILVLIVMSLLGSLLAACGGAPAPVAFNALPVFAGATVTTNATLLEAITTQVEKAKAGGQVKNVEGQVYDVPADTTWDAVSSFYKTELEKGGWKVAQTGENLLAFSRGKQAFVLNFAAGPVLITVLTEEN